MLSPKTFIFGKLTGETFLEASQTTISHRLKVPQGQTHKMFVAWTFRHWQTVIYVRISATFTREAKTGELNRKASRKVARSQWQAQDATGNWGASSEERMLKYL